jgi:hypothetical protein
MILMAALTALSASPLAAETLVSSSFSSGEDRVPLAALNDVQSAQSPDGANISGGLWQLAGGGAYDGWMSDNAARMHNGGAVAISLGDRSKNAVVTISAEITFGMLPPDADEESPKVVAMRKSMANGMALLGFYSELEETKHRNPLRNFTGLRLGFDGSLQLVVNGRAEGASLAAGAEFDPHAPVVLGCTVDTATGKLLDVRFAGKTLAEPFATAAFTPAATALAGFGGSLGNHPIHVEFRNFEVSAKAAP